MVIGSLVEEGVASEAIEETGGIVLDFFFYEGCWSWLFWEKKGRRYARED